MADVRPIKALRPVHGLDDKIAALPYDVYSRAEAYELTRGDELSFLRIDRPETQFEPDHDMYAPEVYAEAGEMLHDMIDNGSFVRDDKPYYYIYALTMDGVTQNGIAACASAADYRNGVIKKHENTREDKLIDRVNHIRSCHAQTGPVFLSYHKNDVISGIIEETEKTEPECDFTTENTKEVRHRVWKIADPDKTKIISKEFASIGSIYIADGHHRCASAVKIADENKDDEEAQYFLSVLFPAEELRILPYNRVIKSLNGMTMESFCQKLTQMFHLEASETEVYPDKKGTVGFYDGKRWYRLTIPDKMRTGDPVGDLDVSILQDNVFSPLLGIDDPRKDERIDFVGGIRGCKELERRCSRDCICAFSMYPTSMNELMKVADSGRLMPPKSTWFEPKLLSGLFIHEI